VSESRSNCSRTLRGARAYSGGRASSRRTTVGESGVTWSLEFPELGGQRASVGFASNQEDVDAGFKPRKGDENRVIPPVRQVARRRPHTSAKLQSAKSNRRAALEREVADPQVLVNGSFTGTTRRDNAGRVVITPSTSLRADGVSRCASSPSKQARDGKIPRSRTSRSRRRVEIGGDAVAIHVSAPHRAEAFEAAASHRSLKNRPMEKKNISNAAKYGSAARPRTPRRLNSNSILRRTISREA